MKAIKVMFLFNTPLNHRQPPFQLYLFYLYFKLDLFFSLSYDTSFFYLVPKLWNNLPNTVREADTLWQFKSRLKTHLSVKGLLGCIN